MDNLKAEAQPGAMRSGTKLPRIQTFEQLLVWQKAHQFVLAVYKLTEKFPPKETSGLTFQFRRAAISIPANIPEGYKKSRRLDKLGFFNTARSSLEECRYYMILTRDLGYGDVSPLFPLLNETDKLLQAYSGAIGRSLAVVGVIGLGFLLILSSTS